MTDDDDDDNDDDDDELSMRNTFSMTNMMLMLTYDGV